MGKVDASASLTEGSFFMRLIRVREVKMERYTKRSNSPVAEILYVFNPGIRLLGLDATLLVKWDMVATLWVRSAHLGVCCLLLCTKGPEHCHVLIHFLFREAEKWAECLHFGDGGATVASLTWVGSGLHQLWVTITCCLFV